MKIVFLSTILNHVWGGADALWTTAAEASVARGDSVLLVISELVADHPRVRTLAEKGASLHVRPRNDLPTSLLTRGLRRARETLGQQDPLVGRLRAFVPDLVVLSGGGTYDPILEPSVCTWLQTSQTPYRVIANFQNEHPSLSEIDRTQAREILGTAERILFVSPRNLAITRRHLLHALPNAECIHGVMVHNAMPATTAPWPTGEIYGFATIARLEPVKGIDLMLHALATGLRDVPGWHFNVYGRGQQQAYLAEVAQSLGLSSRVTVHGFVDSLDAAWRDNQLLVSSSIDEGIPMTIPEAMLHGRAVLATRVGAAEEWIEPGRTGFLCPAPTIELLAETLREAWATRPHWRAMGEAAAQDARTRYRADDYLKIIRPLSESPAR